MTEPALLVLDDEPDDLDQLQRTLGRRYGQEYLVICEASAAAALDRLAQLAADGRPVAIVCAAAAMIDSGGGEFLAMARRLHPAAKRVLTVPRGGSSAPTLRVPALLLQDPSVAQPVLRAMTLGVVDTYLPSPHGGRDEGFHLAISELLEEWARDSAEDQPAVHIIGEQHSARAHELRDLLTRNGIPFEFSPADSDRGRLLLEQSRHAGSALPVVITYTGHTLADPNADELGAAFGLATLPAGTVDVAIVGAGPAGLSAAVYTASEGLATLLIEREAIGGQAGSSSLIRNYLGFPRGISGRSLANRAFAQVWSFGAGTVVTGPVTGLRPAGSGYLLSLADASEVTCRSVVVATGVSYRRLDAPGLAPLIGAGVYYGAAASEARAMAGRRVFIAGGANSAGQAAVNLARHASQVTLLVRRDSVAATMSRYLIDEIDGTANIDIRHNTEVVGAEGDEQLEALVLQDNTTGVTESVSGSALFVLIGADPHTDWLPAGVQRDDHGFLLTGSDLRRVDPPDGWPLQRPPLPLETSLPGVFAAGDVRQRSVKRVASAVGEGSIAATQVTQYLQEPDQPS
ncbi:MAG TPA: FAD-dependent oxidoreductase [Jiangellaceae bacterium]|nr:FAD-dependent oxidoreductase [Jiangellaceae bacterium]